jgi:hypothetical protein
MKKVLHIRKEEKDQKAFGERVTIVQCGMKGGLQADDGQGGLQGVAESADERIEIEPECG